jgi:hypothetical protein
MDVNEHDRLSKITLPHKLKLKEKHIDCCSIPRSFVMTISGISFGFCKIKKDIQNTVTCLN